jgi:lauroyl/myristoyl acyltransferase
MSEGDAPTSAISGSDIAGLLGLPPLILAALILPPTIWTRLGRSVASLAKPFLGHSIERLDQAIGEALSPGEAPESVALDLVGNEIARHLLTMRTLSPFDGSIRTDVIGSEHLSEALRRGKGAVIWDSQFYFANVATKLGLKRAGFDLFHMSSPSHGVSDTSFGRRLLNPIWVGAEAKNLAERIVVSYSNPRRAMALLSQHLVDGKIVSVSVRATSVKPATAPFLNRELRLGPGAVALAHRAGAPLIPVFTVQTEPGNYTTTVEAPLDLPVGIGRHEATSEAARLYAVRLAPYVRAYPGQWQGWRD